MTTFILTTLFSVLLVFGVLYYGLERYRDSLSLLKLKSHNAITEPPPKASVVLFFKNKLYSSQTVKELLTQNYAGTYSIWLVGQEGDESTNDPRIHQYTTEFHSTETELDILKNIAAASDDEVLLSLYNGISISPEWLNAMTREFEPGIEVVRAPLIYSNVNKKPWIKESLVLYYNKLNLLEASRIVRQKNVFIPTENTAFLKSFLLSNTQPIFNKPGRIQYTIDPNALAQRKGTARALIKKHQFCTALKSTPLLMRCFLVTLTFSAFLSVFSPKLLLTTIIAFILKSLMDILFIIRGMKTIGTQPSWKSLVVFELLHAPFVTFCSLLSFYHFLRMKNKVS